MKLRLRDLEAGELASLEAVRAAAFAPVFAGFRAAVGEPLASIAFAAAEAEQAALLARLCAPGSGSAVMVAERDGAVAGFVCFSMDAAGLGEIGLNAVHPDHARQGIGTALYRAAMRRMRAAGMRAVTVSTGGDPAHAPARAAYAKLGFRAAIPSVSLYRMLEEDA